MSPWPPVMENLSRSNFYNGTQGQLNAKVCQQARCAAALECCSCSVAFLQPVLMSSAGRVSIPPHMGKGRHSIIWAVKRFSARTWERGHVPVLRPFTLCSQSTCRGWVLWLGAPDGQREAGQIFLRQRRGEPLGCWCFGSTGETKTGHRVIVPSRRGKDVPGEVLHA